MRTETRSVLLQVSLALWLHCADTCGKHIAEKQSGSRPTTLHRLTTLHECLSQSAFSRARWTRPLEFQCFAAKKVLFSNIKTRTFWPLKLLKHKNKNILKSSPNFLSDVFLISVEGCTFRIDKTVGAILSLKSWEAPLKKYIDRASTWFRPELGFSFNCVCYRTFVFTVLSFVWQLEDVPEIVLKEEIATLRKFTPGPAQLWH